MSSVTYAIDRRTALLIREIVRDTPLAHEWERAVMWDHPSHAAPRSISSADDSKLHATLSVHLLERLTTAVYGTQYHFAYERSRISRREVSTYVHRMEISAKRRLNVWG